MEMASERKKIAEYVPEEHDSAFPGISIVETFTVARHHLIFHYLLQHQPIIILRIYILQ